MSAHWLPFYNSLAFFTVSADSIGWLDSPTGEAVPTRAGFTGEGVHSLMMHGASTPLPQNCKGAHDYSLFPGPTMERKTNRQTAEEGQKGI